MAGPNSVGNRQSVSSLNTQAPEHTRAAKKGEWKSTTFVKNVVTEAKNFARAPKGQGNFSLGRAASLAGKHLRVDNQSRKNDAQVEKFAEKFLKQGRKWLYEVGDSKNETGKKFPLEKEFQKFFGANKEKLIETLKNSKSGLLHGFLEEGKNIYLKDGYGNYALKIKTEESKPKIEFMSIEDYKNVEKSINDKKNVIISDDSSKIQGDETTARSFDYSDKREQELIKNLDTLISRNSANKEKSHLAKTVSDLVDKYKDKHIIPSEDFFNMHQLLEGDNLKKDKDAVNLLKNFLELKFSHFETFLRKEISYFINSRQNYTDGERATLTKDDEQSWDAYKEELRWLVKNRPDRDSGKTAQDILKKMDTLEFYAHLPLIGSPKELKAFLDSI